MGSKISTNGLYMENLYRPIYEINAAYAWGAASLSTVGAWLHHGTQGFEIAAIPAAIAAVTLGMSLKRFKDSLPQLRRQLKLEMNYKFFLDGTELYENNQKDLNKAYLGRGFEWTIAEANRAYQLIATRPEHLQGFLPLPVKLCTSKLRKDTEELEGKPWIHGCGDEKELWYNASIFASHSLYTGLPGSGKTTMLTLNSVGALHRGNAVMVVDPKNDYNWRTRLKAEAKRLGVPFHYFNISKPSESVRIDPLRNFTVSTEIASRLSNVLEKGSGSSEGFRAYAWDSFYVTADALRFVGKKPSVKMVADYMLNRKTELASDALSKIMSSKYGEHWQSSMAEQLTKDGGGSLLVGMIRLYQNVLVPEGLGEDSVSGFLGFVTHDQSHQSKMLATTKPMLQQLTAAPLDELLSPDPDVNDDRPIIDIKKFVDTGGVLYIATDSSGNPSISSAVSKLIMEDACAAAATRYNFEEGKGMRVSIFGDEIHAALSEGLINLAAMGRGASFELHLSTQGIPDLIDKAGDAVANRIQSLTSNWFCLRAQDGVTKESMKSHLPEVPIRTKQWQLSNNTDNSSALHSYSGSVGERLMDQDKPLFPPQLLSDLPKLQYFAKLATGQFVHGRIPIIN